MYAIQTTVTFLLKGFTGRGRCIDFDHPKSTLDSNFSLGLAENRGTTDSSPVQTCHTHDRRPFLHKVLEVASLPGPYIANAAVLSCFDHRITKALSEFLRRQGIYRSDMITVAGGGKALASPRSESDRDFVLEQLHLSIRLHRPKRVFVITHSDCGAYGGLVHFRGDRDREREWHEGELKRGTEVVMKHFPGISVNAYFLDFEAVWSV